MYCTLHCNCAADDRDMPPKRKRKILGELDANVQQPAKTPYVPLERNAHPATSLLPAELTPIELFTYFLDSKLLQIICDNTNAYFIRQIIAAGASAAQRQRQRQRQRQMWDPLQLY